MVCFFRNSTSGFFLSPQSSFAKASVSRETRSSSAGWEPAVSQIGNLRNAAADCQSAIQQTNCLRYYSRTARNSLRPGVKANPASGFLRRRGQLGIYDLRSTIYETNGKARMTNRLICTACGEFKTLAACKAPCSVKA